MSDITEPLTQRQDGFDTPTVRQLTVFLDNRVGLLQLLLRVLSETGIVISGFSVEESAECALVRLLVARPDACIDVFHKHGFPFSRTDVLVVVLPEGVGNPLLAVCSALLAAEINIHYTYPLLQNSIAARSRSGAIVLSVDDPALGAQVLMRKRMTVLSESDLEKS